MAWRSTSTLGGQREAHIWGSSRLRLSGLHQLQHDQLALEKWRVFRLIAEPSSKDRMPQRSFISRIALLAMFDPHGATPCQFLVHAARPRDAVSLFEASTCWESCSTEEGSG